MGRYDFAKGDIALLYKHADVVLRGHNHEGLALFWYNSPTRGKCSYIIYEPDTYPLFEFYVKANWKAKLCIKQLKDLCDFIETGPV